MDIVAILLWYFTVLSITYLIKTKFKKSKKITVKQQKRTFREYSKKLECPIHPPIIARTGEPLMHKMARRENIILRRK